MSTNPNNPERLELENYRNDTDILESSTYRYGTYWKFIQSMIDIAEKNTIIITTDSHKEFSRNGNISLNNNTPVISVSGTSLQTKGLKIDLDKQNGEHKFQDIAPPGRIADETNNRNYEKEMGHLKDSGMNMNGLALDIAGFRSNMITTTKTLRIPVEQRTTPGPDATPDTDGPTATISDLEIVENEAENQVEIQTQITATVDSNKTSLNVDVTFEQYDDPNHNNRTPLRTKSKTIQLADDPNSNKLIRNETINFPLPADTFGPGDTVTIRQQLPNHNSTRVKTITLSNAPPDIDISLTETTNTTTVGGINKDNPQATFTITNNEPVPQDVFIKASIEDHGSTRVARTVSQFSEESIQTDPIPTKEVTSEQKHNLRAAAGQLNYESTQTDAITVQPQTQTPSRIEINDGGIWKDAENARLTQNALVRQTYQLRTLSQDGTNMTDITTLSIENTDEQYCNNPNSPCIEIIQQEDGPNLKIESYDTGGNDTTFTLKANSGTNTLSVPITINTDRFRAIRN